MIFEISGSNKIGLQLDGSTFLPFLKIGFSFATLQALGNIPWEIERLQISLIGLDKILAPFFRNLPSKEFVHTSSFENLNIFHYFKNFLFWSTFNVKQLRVKKYSSNKEIWLLGYTCLKGQVV